MDAISIRRSVRTFQNMPVEREKIQSLLEAAMQAPTAGNGQTARYLVIEGEAARKSLAASSPYAGPAAKAPLNIIVLAEEKGPYPAYWQQDCSNACINILHRAVELELGGVWLALAPEEERMEAVSKIFSLPEGIKPFALLAIGYPQDKNANRFVSRFDPQKIHWEQW